jgi:hypothetical protein
MRDLASHNLEALRFEFRRIKSLGDRGLGQVRDAAALEHRLDPESNSIGILVRHLRGNMRSRWTDFLTSDGEKAGRNREAEFDTNVRMSRQELTEAWEEGWGYLFGALDSLGGGDLLTTVRIRGEELSVVEALIRQLSHYAYHVGQIVLLAKHLAGPAWTSLSIPRGESNKPWRYKKDPGASA